MGIRVLVNGAFGRMGQVAVAAINETPDLILAAELGREDDLAKMISASRADVVLDLTNAAVVERHAKIILASGVRAVIGTSGLSTDALAQLARSCQAKRLGILVVPNFSLGAILMMQFAAQAAKFMSAVEIIERHHDGKLDSPSGTALRTAEYIAEYRTLTSGDVVSGIETVAGARGAIHHGVPIHAVRLPGLVAHQEVIFGGQSETLTIQHDSLHRDCYKPGIVMALRQVMGLNQLVHGLSLA